MNEISVGASGDDNNIILHLVCCFRAGAAWWEILKADCRISVEYIYMFRI